MSLLSPIFHLKPRKHLLIFILVFSTSAFSANGYVYVSGLLGTSRAKFNNSDPQITYYDDQLTDAYPIRDNHEKAVIVGLSGGYEFPGIHNVPLIALGLGIYGAPNEYNYRGQLIETAVGDPSSLLYSYKFHVKSIRAIVETKFTWIWKQFSPFVDVGVGLARTCLNGYRETPIDSIGYVPLPPFHSRSSTSFAYQVGFGIGYMINFLSHAPICQERISLGYRYVDLGNTAFGTRGIDYPYRLDMGRLRTIELYLAYTYYFKGKL